MAKNYRDFPEVLERHIDQDRRGAIKEMVQGYVEVIDWHQDPDDKDAGDVDIRVFERPRVEPLAPAPTATSGQNVAVDGMSWLLELDSNQRPSG